MDISIIFACDLSFRKFWPIKYQKMHFNHKLKVNCHEMFHSIFVNRPFLEGGIFFLLFGPGYINVTNVICVMSTIYCLWVLLPGLIVPFFHKLIWNTGNSQLLPFSVAFLFRLFSLAISFADLLGLLGSFWIVLETCIREPYRNAVNFRIINYW